jgi:hypothetical protein
MRTPAITPFTPESGRGAAKLRLDVAQGVGVPAEQMRCVLLAASFMDLRVAARRHAAVVGQRAQRSAVAVE